MTQSLRQIYDAKVAQGELRPDPAQWAVLPALDRLRNELSQQPEPPRAKTGLLKRLGLRAERPVASSAPTGLYIWGGVGRGKSMLMDLFVEETKIEPRRRVHFHAFMQEVQAGLEQARRDGQRDAVRPVAQRIAGQARLLCLDEMQITDIADAMIVGRLFEYLFEQGVAIVTTSNRAPEDLYKNGLNRQLFLPFIDLIRDRMEIHELESETDYRQHRLEGAQIWFSPADRAGTKAMDEIWDDLTGHAAGAPLDLSVMGRTLQLPRHYHGVARASFWDLCGNPLGPADYLAIGDAVRVLMIDTIPSLSAENFNQARRFVTLIDALYEARVELVASAAAMPEQLYIEGEGAFEFERTASRLREMMAADWVRPQPD